MIHYRLALKNDAYFIDGKGNGQNRKICSIYHMYDNICKLNKRKAR